MSHSAFMDDTIWVSESRRSLQQIVNTSNEFFLMNDVKINGDKSELLVINSALEKHDQHIWMGTPQVKIIANNKSEPIRFLGVWLRERKGPSHITNMLHNIIKDFICRFKGKKLTVAHFEYINNIVLIPTLNYCSQIVCLSNELCDKIHSKYLQLVKTKM